MTTRLKQLTVLAVGLVGAFVMVLLGLWQLQVFVDKGNRGVEERARQPAVALADYLTPGGLDGDVYGKPVTVDGRYVASQELLLPAEGGVRVLTAFELADGRVLPVVRGIAPSEATVPPAPEGPQSETGLLLPGEGDVEGTAPGALASVRMPLLAQQWPQTLVPGFVTLSAEEASAQGLTIAAVDLPEGQGSFQNGGYALQWWVFAAFGLGMAIRIAHTLGRRDALAREEAARAELGTDDERMQTP